MTSAANESLSTESVAFLNALKANNTREWFADNKSWYEQAIKRPVSRFQSEMATGLQALTGVEHTSKLYRIHRDLRFSKDKTPYNTHVHISFVPRSDLSSPPCWFFGLDTQGLKLGAGVFAFDKPSLEGFRTRVDGTDGTGLAKLLGALEGEGATLSEPDLKRVPSGYACDHPHAGLLRHKGLSVWIEVDDTESDLDAGLVRTCCMEFSRLKPVYDWLMAV